MSSSTSYISKFIHSSAFRPTLAWFMYLLGTGMLVLTVSILGITPGWTATPATAATAATHSVTVSFRDLDLSSPAGVNALYRRIQSAAKQVCGSAGPALAEQSDWKDCYRKAITDAVGKVNNPMLTALHTGRPAPAKTAMLVK